MAEKTRAEELHDEYRKKVWEDTKSGTENFDKYLLTFSSGALGLSLAFIKDVAPIGHAVWIPSLFASWVAFLLCILVTLISFRISILALEAMVPHLNDFYLNNNAEAFDKQRESWLTKMFEHFTGKIRDVGEGNFDRDWFRSDEFQTLLYDALQQLHVTHDREKIEMLGVALANSGTDGFREDERKDLFIRLLRDLTRSQLALLAQTASERLEFVKKSLGRSDKWLACRMLETYGLVRQYPPE